MINLNVRLSISWGIWSIILFFTGFQAYRNLQKLSEAAELVAHTHEMLEATQATLMTLIEAEAAQRGYLITGSRLGLERYRTALAKLRGETQGMRDRAPDSQRQETMVRNIEALIDTRVGELQEALVLNEKDPVSARHAVAAHEVRDTMGSIDGIFAAIRNDDLSLLAERQKANEHAYHAAIFSGVVSRILGLAGLAMLLLQVIKANRDRDRLEVTRERERRLMKVTLRSLGDALITTDAAGAVEFMNPMAETLTGWQLGEAIGRPLAEIFHIVDELTRDPAASPVWSVLHGGVVLGLVPNTALVSREGHEVPIEDSAAPIKDEAGAVVGVALVFRDVTEKRKTELELAQSELRFRKLTELSPNAIWVNRSDRIELANPEACRLMGASAPDQLDGRSVYEIWHPDDHGKVRERVQAGIGGQVVHRSEEKIVRLDGSVRTLEVSSAPFMDSKGCAVQYVLTDITERKEAESALKATEARMIQAQRLEALGVLVAGVAHNFNNIMAIIMGTASMQEQMVKDPAQLEALRIIDTASMRGRDLVRSLTQFARPSMPNLVPFELGAHIAELRLLLGNTAKKNIAIVASGTGEPVWILGDPGSLNAALMNLCLNSLDAMPHGGTLTLRTAIPDPGTVEVTVEDTGEGMDPATLARATEPFFTTKAVDKGTGLGLSVTHGVIQAHGGTMQITSVPGQGTQVKLRIPRRGIPDQEAAAPAPPRSLGLSKVLVVDDEEEVRAVLTLMLTMAGAGQVEMVDSGSEALVRLDSGEVPDLIILDQNMPGLDGVQTLALIRAKHPDIPVLISSGELGLKERDGFLQDKVGVISKPFTLSEIREKLAELGADQMES